MVPTPSFVVYNQVPVSYLVDIRYINILVLFPPPLRFDPQRGTLCFDFGPFGPSIKNFLRNVIRLLFLGLRERRWIFNGEVL